MAQSELKELQSFAQGLLKDDAAVRAAFTLDWSNGQVEGQVNKVKMVKRAMYARASFPCYERGWFALILQGDESVRETRLLLPKVPQTHPSNVDTMFLGTALRQTQTGFVSGRMLYC